MGWMRTLFIIALILLAWWYVAPQSFENQKTALFDKLGRKDPLGDTTGENKLRSTIDNTVDKVIEKKGTTTNNTTNNATDLNSTTTIISLEPCEWTNSGYPNYYGTEKEGAGCNNVPIGQDNECISNPPTNYDGWVNALQKTSDPEIKCCATTGKCMWN
jgi:hypothetical protein